MMHVAYVVQPGAIDIRTVDNVDYIIIRENIEQKEIPATEEEPATTIWECDENQIVAPHGELDLDKVRENPAAYMLYNEKCAKLEILHTAWLEAEATGTVTVDDITIDATSRSNRDIEGLIVSMEAQGTASTMFCAADNSFHEVSLAQLKNFQLAVIGLGQRLYSRKWELRTAIEAAETLADLESINISFVGV